jgi:hypothetical protein
VNDRVSMYGGALKIRWVGIRMLREMEYSDDDVGL